MKQLFLHCRPGFEKECAAEVMESAQALGEYGYIKAQPNSAHLLFVPHDPEGTERLIRELSFGERIFVRQWFAALPIVTNLPSDDRITPLLAAAEELPAAQDLVIETPDTNEGKALSALGKKFKTPFNRALSAAGKLDSESPWHLHLVFLSGHRAYVGVSLEGNRADWPMGIPRLRQPKAAPSRATLKLEEAWHHFVPTDEWETRLAGGMRAVDLGAAPGGWTWQLVKRGLFVEAVDNGPMDQALMESGQVNHQREDGFVYRPARPVDWLVCDIADKPARVAALMADWVARGWCREAVFNLKLPMKQRYAEVSRLQGRIENTLSEAGISGRVRFKQLYHDREEVTGHIRTFPPT